jgi:hypothetical protein
MKTFSTKKTSELKTDFELPFALFDEVNEVTQENEQIIDGHDEESIINEPEQIVPDSDKTIIEVVEPETQTMGATKDEPEIHEPKIDYDSIDISELSIDQLLQLKVNKFNIGNVTIKHLGYNTIDDYVITEYDLIDNETNNVLLIINVRLKQVRFQIPKHKSEPEQKPKSKKSKKKEQTPLEQLAREIQKDLKYSWSDWF